MTDANFVTHEKPLDIWESVSESIHFISFLIPTARLHIQYPMLFKLTNKKKNRETHCGVLEFVADEGRIYIPYWVCTIYSFTLIPTDGVNL